MLRLICFRFADILRSAQERQPGDVSSSVPSFTDAAGDVDMRKVYCRWTRNARKSDQQRGTRSHVRLLHARGNGTRIQEVSVVEEAPDDCSNGTDHYFNLQKETLPELVHVKVDLEKITISPQKKAKKLPKTYWQYDGHISKHDLPIIIFE